MLSFDAFIQLIIVNLGGMKNVVVGALSCVILQISLHVWSSVQEEWSVERT